MFSAVKEPVMVTGSSLAPEGVMVTFVPVASTDPATLSSLDSERVSVPP